MEQKPNPDPEVAWADFLTSVPPQAQRRISDLVTDTLGTLVVNTPDLHLYCTSDICGGERVFTGEASPEHLEPKQSESIFLTYVCRNCRSKSKIFALLVFADGVYTVGTAIKIGEWPPFGPPTPTRLISLVGPDRDIFLKGRRAENQGLGIGAFAYYRRVVENQKDRLFDVIIRVARRVGAKQDTISLLEKAGKETQFTKALEAAKDIIPESLLIEGRNPLTLLHKALSQGLHAKSDDECLQAASSIRIVLAELSERIGQVLKDDAELKTAVSRLMQSTTTEEAKSDGEPS